jgi:hypothetical protein
MEPPWLDGKSQRGASAQERCTPERASATYEARKAKGALVDATYGHAETPGQHDLPLPA